MTTPAQTTGPTASTPAPGASFGSTRPGRGQLRAGCDLSGQGRSTTNAPLHEGDPAAQVALAMTNMETVLAAGGMTLADVLR